MTKPQKGHPEQKTAVPAVFFRPPGVVLSMRRAAPSHCPAWCTGSTPTAPPSPPGPHRTSYLPSCPARAGRGLCFLSSSYIFYLYIVVVVEGAFWCGQLGFIQPRRALAIGPTLCTHPCCRCLRNGDKTPVAHFAVDNRPVVPDLSTALRTGRFKMLFMH